MSNTWKWERKEQNTFEDCGCEKVGHTQAVSHIFQDKIKLLFKNTVEEWGKVETKLFEEEVRRKSDSGKQDFLK